MEDRLKGLRKSMENTTFKHLSFLIAPEAGARKIKQSSEKEEDILLAVLQLLMNEKQVMN